MSHLNVNGKRVELNEEGFLVDFDEWSPEVARSLAAREDIGELAEEHLRVLYKIREYYEQFRVAPMVHLLVKECDLSFRDLHDLFHKQPGKRATRLAGLPEATGCV
jgi:dissimilatory sulfite reductase related protein